MFVNIIDFNSIIIKKILKICKMVDDMVIDYYYVDICLKFKFDDIDRPFNINEIESENVL